MSKEAKKIARAILADKKFDDNIEGHYGREIIDLLRKGGAKDTKAHDACSKATYEQRVKLKDGRKVNVINSYFMGAFTQIDCYSS